MLRAEQALNMVNVVHLLVFLYDGRYRTLADRLLSMRLVYRRQNVLPNASFEFQNRQLAWHAFTVFFWVAAPQQPRTEFLLFILPLVNVQRWRARLGRWFRQAAAAATNAARPMDETSSTVVAPGEPTEAAEGSGACGLCGVNPIVLPYVTDPCRHRFCYVCVTSAQLADGSTACPSCGAAVQRLDREAARRARVPLTGSQRSL